ncbi:MAG TPA: putative peptidoglycan glycosyltransferase FtsW [Rectinema sp.]|nr:putative peptidoglycan glycosyltransferase FtsW [Rectinema sp.]HPD68763.1 putative peptidoglycan glycosyltransferase FtsW [Rectinema sp.]HRU76971.1 putative peptidoglycan glycosyltransferase FtsW [Rectinema sp.]
MKEESKSKSLLIDSHRIDWQMVCAIIIVSLIGIMTLWSGSIGFAIRNGGPNSVIIKQAILYAASLICMAVAAVIPMKLLRAVLPVAVVLCVIGLSLPIFSPLGMTINRARRWIRIGSFSLQPSEIWKPVMVLYLASFLEKRKERLVESGLVALPAIVLVIISAVLIFLQQDFSTSILVLAIAFAMLYLAGTPFLFMSNLALFLILYGALMIFSSQYRVQRLVGFLMPEQHTQTVNYQMYSALRAIRSGGVWGKGVGLGTLKISSIPEVQSDFIFAAFVEESGFAGVLVVMGLWSFILIRAGRILIGSDYFSRLAGFGMITLLSLQVLLNLAVVTGVMPTTGLALPFFSAGGSALLMSAISCGILINLSRSGQTETGMRAALRKEGAAYD